MPSQSGLQGGFSGEVYMKPWGVGAAKATNSLPFQFYPHPPPTIMSTNPGIGASGRQITLRGVNFRPDDEIHSFAGDEPEPDKVVSRQYVSATQVNITLPMYMLPQKIIELYVFAQYSGGPMKGPTYKLLGQSPNKKQPANKDDSMPTG